jgi:hypothetical protein
MMWQELTLPTINLYNAPKGRLMASTNQVQEVRADLHTHEEVCAIRYEGINARLARMEKIIMAVFAGIVFLLIKVLISLGGL